jgi:hypothetical protein
MNLKLIVGISVIAAVPVCAQAQKPRAVTEADAENVVKIISGDKAKTRTYCDIVELANQFDEADQNDTKKRWTVSANG